jgi:hypothetical protein
MSAAKGRKRMDVLIESQHRRQAILDFLHAHGPATNRQIGAATGESTTHLGGILGPMQTRGEIDGSGKRGETLYRALAAVTVTAQTMYESIRDHRDCKQRARDDEASRAAREPWRTVHKGGRAEAMKGQGGQGAAYARACIGSGMYAQNW